MSLRKEIMKVVAPIYFDNKEISTSELCILFPGHPRGTIKKYRNEAIQKIKESLVFFKTGFDS